MKKNILILTPSIYPIAGGLQRYSYNLALSLTKLNFNVRVLVLENQLLPENISDSLIFEKINHLRNPNNILQKIKQKLIIRKSLIKSIHEIKPDFLICTWWEPLGYLLIFLSKPVYTKTILIGHGQELFNSTGNKLVRALKKKLLILTIKNFNTLIGVSNFTKSRLLELGANPSSTFYLPNGLEIDYIKKSKSTFKSLPKILQNLKGKIILQTGRVVPRKGHEAIIQIIPKLQSMFKEKIYYVIAGDGTYIDHLKKIVKKSGYEEQVIFLGYINDNELHGCYNLADLVVMLSNNRYNKGDVEGFGIVYLEAYAHGKPVIAAPTGGVCDAVIDKETGILVNPEIEEDIIKAIYKLLNNYNYSQFLGSNGQKLINTTFNWDNISKQMIVISNS